MANPSGRRTEMIRSAANTLMRLILWFLLTDADCAGGSAANFSVLQTTRDQVRPPPSRFNVTRSCSLSRRACFHDSQTHTRSSSAACCSSSSADRLHFAVVWMYIFGDARMRLLCITASATLSPSFSVFFLFFFRSQKNIHKLKHAHKVSLPHPWSLPV